MDSAASPPIHAAGRAAAPVEDKERIDLLDVLRGLAIGGILLVNLGSMAHPLDARTSGPLEPRPELAQYAADAARFLAEGKFYTLFSLLFGLGFWLQMSRAADASATTRFARRLGVLAAIGFVHGAFIWAGDILLPYAVLGFLLLAVRSAKPKTLLVWSGVLLTVSLVMLSGFAGVWHLVLTFAPDLTGDFERELHEELVAAYAAYGGSLGQVVLQRLVDWISYFLMTVFLSAPTILAMFFLGVWAGKTGVAADPASHASLLRRVIVVGLLFGLPANLVYTWLSRDPTAQLSDASIMFGVGVSSVVAGPLLCVAIASAIALLFLRPFARRVLSVFAPVGRMALTNYLLQSIVGTTIFYGGLGFGLIGSTGPLEELALCAVIFGAQLVLSHVWLRHFRFGPAEWLWRSATYGVRQPMRARTSGAPSPGGSQPTV